jgi:hypothetical protein
MVYRSKGEQIMVLSHKKIEEIAIGVMKDFNTFFFGAAHETQAAMPSATPIDQFASHYLNLKVSFTRLSADGTLCGLTAYEDTEYVCDIDGITRTIPIKRNQILLDSSFIEPGQIRKLCGKRRFTLAHECAHQFLYQLESEEGKLACRRLYAERKCYSLRELKTREDWNEWQANVLGAAILMPCKEIEFAVRRFHRGEGLINYAGYMTYADRLCLKTMRERFGVSRTAMMIRLRQLGFLEDRPYTAYQDLLEVLT